jgi:hypothetical protein
MFKPLFLLLFYFLKLNNFHSKSISTLCFRSRRVQPATKHRNCTSADAIFTCTSQRGHCHPFLKFQLVLCKVLYLSVPIGTHILWNLPLYFHPLSDKYIYIKAWIDKTCYLFCYFVIYHYFTSYVEFPHEMPWFFFHGWNSHVKAIC